MSLQRVFLGLFFSLSVCLAKTPAGARVLGERGETATQHDERLRWFREARFGMFVHWGLYAQAGGIWKGKETTNADRYAEWLMAGGRVPVGEYAALAKDFNPTGYDADAWVRLAKSAGVKYIVVTAKHHEGFAMFRTKASAFNIVDATPYKRDPLADLVKACRKYGVKIGLYYSQNLDWHHPGGGCGSGGNWDVAQKGDERKYVREIVMPQLREILTQYGKIDMMWFDIPDGAVNAEEAKEIHRLVVGTNSQILINNRLGRGFENDLETPEQNVPPTGLPNRDWEVCMTMNGTWGYNKADQNWKSTRELVEKLADVASKGGNLLLNVGPDEKGRIPEASQLRLSEIGAWLRVNGEAIYGTKASLFPELFGWGRVTVRDGKSPALYACVFSVPADGVLRFSGLLHTRKQAYVLGTGEKVSCEVQSGDVVLKLPESLRDRHDFVIKILLDKPAELLPRVP